mmetsp:Transcript_24008/g.36903  ORF Transcript_24008/g.36903 Transcript_24008/m.36903 type:complete len:87 (-) Transcript_24008:1278-1538(-)
MLELKEQHNYPPPPRPHHHHYHDQQESLSYKSRDSEYRRKKTEKKRAAKKGSLEVQGGPSQFRQERERSRSNIEHYKKTAESASKN